MKQTILVCDCCKDVRNPAVATLSLNDGRGTNPVSLDICQVHLKGVRQYIASIRHAATERLKGDEIDSFQKKIVAFVVQNPGSMVKHIGVAVGGPITRVGYHVKQLVANKTLKRTGVKSHSKYFPAK